MNGISGNIRLIICNQNPSKSTFSRSHKIWILRACAWYPHTSILQPSPSSANATSTRARTAESASMIPSTASDAPAIPHSGPADFARFPSTPPLPDRLPPLLAQAVALPPATQPANQQQARLSLGLQPSGALLVHWLPCLRFREGTRYPASQPGMKDSFARLHPDHGRRRRQRTREWTDPQNMSINQRNRKHQGCDSLWQTRIE